jgi:hypothetical protein
MSRLLAIATVTLTAAALTWADDSNTFQWQGEMAPGQTLSIRGISGSVVADLAPGTQAQVTAVKSGVRDAPSQVEIREKDSYNGPLICVVYPNGPNTCDPVARSGRASDVQVQFTVHVPAGVLLDASTLNGDIRVTELTADVTATTLNGQIALTGIGFVRATNVNGSILVSIKNMDWTGRSTLTTVNGSIDVALPGTANVVVHATTVAGSVSSDFPLQLHGSNSLFCTSGSTANGTIGAGGRDLNLTTVTGSIHLRKAE